MRLVEGETPRDVRYVFASDAVKIDVATGAASDADLRATGASVVLPDLGDIDAELEAIARHPLRPNARIAYAAGQATLTTIRAAARRNRQMPFVIGLTGSIAAGKSLLSDQLVERRGAIHANADTLVHRMYDPGTAGFDRIVAEFGDEVIGADGIIDRKVIGNKVFGNRERMSALTTAIGDISQMIHDTIDGWRAELPDDAIAVMEAVNLIEPGYSEWCDVTWLVACENETALPRLMARNSFTEEEAMQRINGARDWRDRAPAADRIFHNDGTLEEFKAEIDAAISETTAWVDAGELPKSRWFEWRREQDKLKAAETANEAGSGSGGDA